MICIFVILFSCSIVSALSNIDGYIVGNLYFESSTCGNKPAGINSEGFGMCVKIFNGPEDPTTELTSYKMVVTSSDDTSVHVSKQLYKDSTCKTPNGNPELTVLPINKCVATAPTTSFQYVNTTKQLLPSPVNGWAVHGFQEYQTCSSNSKITYEFIYPNDNCYVSNGKTSTGVEYNAFVLYCSGKQLTQTFFSDTSCTQQIQKVTLKLGTDGTTCYTNDSPSYDYNLFETMVCVGDSPTLSVEGAVVAKSAKDIKRICPHKLAARSSA